MRKSIGRYDAQKIAMSQAKAMGMNAAEARPHSLILAAKLSATKEQYNISLEHSIQRDILPWTEGLEDRDAYVAVAMGLGLAKVPVISDVEYPGAAQFAFWADPTLFPTAATATTALTEAQALQSIYWGRHSIKTNQGVRIDADPNFWFQTIQETQQAAATANMLTGLELKEIGAAVRFAGGDKNNVLIEFECQDKTDIAGPAAHNNYLVVFFEGAIIKGGTSKAFLR